MAFRFENLEVWHLAITYASSVYKITKKFPKAETFGLTQQVRRAAISVALNIAEGSSRNSNRDFKRFLNIAASSISEVLTGFAIALEQKYICKGDYKNIYRESEFLIKKITALANSLRMHPK